MKPCDGGRGPTRSMWMVLKWASGTGKEEYGVEVWRCTLETANMNVSICVRPD